MLIFLSYVMHLARKVHAQGDAIGLEFTRVGV